jgi:hypothetical protein
MSRATVRCCGSNVGPNDCVVVSFATELTVCSVGLVGWVRRIRAYDETSGEPVRDPQNQHHDPEFWIEDYRTGSMCGPIRRSEIESLIQIDGPWLNDDEMAEAMRSMP